MVLREIARSRGEARELILDGCVSVDGSVVTKPAFALAPTATIEVAANRVRWVGRGAEKLAAALDLWVPRGLRIEAARCVDVGASTGGFTEVLLHHGARHVVALDVGTGQLAPALVSDPRVLERSNTHVLRVDSADVSGPFDVAVIDVSFISLTRVVPHVAPWLSVDGSLVALVKPQFEVGRHALGRNGVVRSDELRKWALNEVVDAAYKTGLGIHDVMQSPLTGAVGNVEYLFWASRWHEGMMDPVHARAAIETVTRRGL